MKPVSKTDVPDYYDGIPPFYLVLYAGANHYLKRVACSHLEPNGHADDAEESKAEAVQIKEGI